MTQTSPPLSFTPLTGIPEINPGDDLCQTIFENANRQSPLDDGDVLVVAQKIVSKAEGRIFNLCDISPSAQAETLANQCHKDARLVELILRESEKVIRAVPGVLIVRHRLGFTLANAGIDQSNVPGEERALLLPVDPDLSALQLQAALEAKTGKKIAVLIADSFGRPFRQGVVGTCIGCAGLSALYDLRGSTDREGRVMAVSQQAVADQLCATATLVSGEADEGTPVVLIRGVAQRYLQRSRPAGDLIRPSSEDLFQ